MTEIIFEEIAEAGSTLWKQKMAEYGNIMSKNHVRQTVFVHGTFVGVDPVGMVGFMKSLGFTSNTTNLLETLGKGLTDYIVSDLGNFIGSYKDLYVKGVNNSINCRLFTWGSENNHIGRLLAVPKLAKDLAKNIDGLSENDRILLIGHSHAGQLFALLTVFLEKSDKAEKLLNILLDTDGFDQDLFMDHLNIISKVFLDIVTLGTPVRYRWGNYSNYQLLNIVNHRSASKMDGVSKTRDGDYIQQWGTDGRDLAPIELSLRDKNKQLDSLLDKGISGISSNVNFAYKLLMKQAESERRQALTENGDLAGTSLFIDYKDGGLSPNDSLFGHGSYTKQNRMLFNTGVIVKSLYPDV